MIEELLAYAILFRQRLVAHNRYQAFLNEAFLQHPKDYLLLELQWCSSDPEKTVHVIMEAVYGKEIDADRFGKRLFKELQLAYQKMELSRFAEIAYSIWRALPSELQEVDPFWPLNYADEPLS